MTQPLVATYAVLLVCLLATIAVAAGIGNVPALVNALVATGAAVLPTFGPVVGGAATVPVLDAAPLLSVWLATAGLVHTVGMFGPYDWVWWWDHVTHTLSATLLAALVYATFLAADRHVAGIGFDAPTLAAGTILVTLALGVVWEFLELWTRELGKARGVDPILEYYGLDDTVYDLAFDVLGAVIVVGLDVRIFLVVVEADPELAASVLGASIVVGFLAVVTIAAWLERRR
ncbi:hypothetical protein L593_13320 [Salinarchaeum sp. Harcht-Bsk1]|uniref:hypothetical protein n=1 Tax=Salinarchaeum sp. Harcht-Bsk1 TaxID=1333523 RepID=UPI0003424469|nr:hypothetical protein [Salinarchaeum sp. Harcht-Bsk1]AGN02603.1 hypothetical protein L593_13320 [Salinarchaeum sp. Harcht-Bsk1]